MPSLSIDGRQISVPDGTTVIQAAEQLGMYIPRYCYHPGLSIAGNCRICLVEVEKFPKLQIACNTPVIEGMEVHTNSDKAEEGRRAVLEFLLANHPLDCPVCDQSGECDLQNFYMNFGLYDPLFREHKVKKKKAVRLGPHVMLDQERCILCSRCVRFTDEITGTGEFGIFNRGDRAELGIYPGEVLDNPYSANVVDICPVGALTESDFRFKARVWYLSGAPSVCNGCSQGCNIDVHYVLDRPHLNDGARIVRVKPRYNPDVNGWWMCDEGRYGFGWVDRARLTKVRGPADESGNGSDATWEQTSVVRGSPDPAREADRRSPDLRAGGDLRSVEWRGQETVPQHRDATWEQALSAISAVLPESAAKPNGGSIGVIASARLTNEELFLIREIFQRELNARVTAAVPEQSGSSDDFLVKADKNPNTLGATLLGLVGPDAIPAGELLDEAADGKLDVLWVFGHDLVGLFGEKKVRQIAGTVPLFVYTGTNENRTAELAHWALPTAAYLEKGGTFVNCHGRVQRIGLAFPPLGNAREDWRMLLELAAELELRLAWKGLEEIFAALAEALAPFAGLSYETLGPHGADIVAADAASGGPTP